MKFFKFFGMIVGIVGILIRPATAADGCGQGQDLVCTNCQDAAAGGCGEVRTGQYQSTITDIATNQGSNQNPWDEVATRDLGWQNITGNGAGDGVTVSGSACLEQEAPYETTIQVPHGTITQNGEATMEVSAAAGTAADCQKFDMSAHTERFSHTSNSIADPWMRSDLNSSACGNAGVSGAAGTPSFSININTRDAYESVANDGRWQKGEVILKITGDSPGGP